MGQWTREEFYMETFLDCTRSRKVGQLDIHKVNLRPIMQKSPKNHQS